MALADETLVARQRADDVFIAVHRATHQYFHGKRITNSVRRFGRSAYSVSANIVLGNARDTLRQKLRFLNVSSPSLNETGYGLHAAHRLGYLSDDVHATLVTQTERGWSALHGLIRGKRARLASKNAGSVTYSDRHCAAA